MSHQNHSFFSFKGILFTFMKNFKIIYETATVSKKQTTNMEVTIGSYENDIALYGFNSNKKKCIFVTYLSHFY